MLLDQVRTFARYNAWANQRVHGTIASLDDAAYRRDGGAFFKSIHGTWNHLLIGDRLWLRRFGEAVEGEAPTALDAILYDDRAALIAARERMDAHVLRFAEGLDDAGLARPVTYATTTGASFTQPLAPLLAHLFNHQTHHRGQVHVLITSSGAPAPALDLIYYLREVG